MEQKRKKKPVRYSKAVINFIADKIESGMSIRQICIRYPDRVPEEKQIHKMKRKHEYAQVTIDTAYQTLLTSLVDRIIDISHQPLEGETREELLREEKERRLQLDSLKFLASKITPKLVPQYSDKVRVEHEGSVEQQFVVVDYALPAPKEVTPVIEDKKDG